MAEFDKENFIRVKLSKEEINSCHGCYFHSNGCSSPTGTKACIDTSVKDRHIYYIFKYSLKKKLSKL